MQDKEVRTSTLLRRIFKAPDLDVFIEKNRDLIQIIPFSTYINQLCASLNQVPEQIIKKSFIERTYGHQIFNGTRKPSRDKVIQLAFGFGLDLDETQKLLQAAQKCQLYPKIMRDAVVIYCLTHLIGMMEAQSMLNDLGLTLLGGDERHE